MGQFDVTGPDKKTYRVTVPEGATQDQAIDYVKKKYYGGATDQPPGPIEKSPPGDDTMGFFERIGVGAEDAFQGAAQWLEHVTPGATYLDSFNNWLVDQGWPGKVLGLGKVDIDPNAGLIGSHGLDRQTREREAEIQRRTPQGVEWPLIGDPARFAGEVMSPAVGALTPARAGAIGAGAIAGGLQPVTEDQDNFLYEKLKQTLLGGATGGAIKGLGKLAGRGFEALMTRLTREYPNAIISEAVKPILEKIAASEEAGGPGAVDLMRLVNEASKRGQPMTITDVASLGDRWGSGKALRAYLGHLYRTGKGTQTQIMKFLYKRDKESPDRIFNNVAKYIHAGDTGETYKTAKMLLDIRSKMGKPLWDKVYQLRGVMSPRLMEFLRDPDARPGLSRGYRLERLKALAEGRPFDPTQEGIVRVTNGPNGELVVELAKVPNMRVLQMLKQGWDQLIDENVDKVTGRLTKTGVELVKVRNAYVQELKELDTTGIYRRALDQWAGDTANYDALAMGKGVFNMSKYEVSEVFDGLTEGEKQFFLLGVADRMRERVAQTGWTADEAKAIFRNEWTKQALRPLFKTPGQADEFLDTVLPSESAMFGVKSEATAGSATAERVAEDARITATQLADFAINAAHGRWHGMAMDLVRLLRIMGQKPNEKVKQKITEIMLQTEFKAGDPVTEALAGRARKPIGQRGHAAVERITGGQEAGRMAGTAVGAPSTYPVVVWHGLKYEQTSDGQLHLLPGQSLRAYDTAKP